MVDDSVARPADPDAQMSNPKRADCGPKLRSTCDRCALLKVRCDKQKPRCERCKAVNASCVYGPYRWKGRTAASARVHDSHNQVSSSRSPTPIRDGSIPSATPSRVPSTGNFWDLALPASGASSSLENPNFATSMFQDTSSGTCMDWGGLPMPTPGTDEADVDGWYARMMDVDPEVKGEPTMLYDHPLMESSIPTPSPVSTSNTPLSHVESTSDFFSTGSAAVISTENTPGSTRSEAPSTQCHCLSLPITVLQDMYQAELGCRLALSEEGNESSNLSATASTTSSSTGLGTANTGLSRSNQIVSISRAAVRHMEQLLTCDCGACARDPTLLFLVTALVSKLLAWYRAVFTVVTRQAASDSRQGGMSTSTSTSTTGAGDALDMSFATPIQVGDFHLDFGSEQRMKAQFLLCEVRRLGRVLDLFATRAVVGMSKRTPIAPVHRFLVESLGQLVTGMKEYCVS